jgi:hypothetical protein
MNLLGASWKTSLAAIGMLLTSILGIVVHLAEGSPVDWTVHVTEIVAAIGLWSAKDRDVTGGARQNNIQAPAPK